jgi:uncharacterized protein
MAQHINQLIRETSPYLLQHAHNPVNWFPWCDAALNKAKEENKPILVSIGYAACHWCHVMERESFEDEVTAAIMNDNFVNIKIDREERPDLDHIYMDAVQAMTGSGGWPLNVFLTPEGKPFYGGTYFPPQKAFNRPSWQEVLQGVVQGFKERRHEIDAQAENLTQHLVQSNDFGLQQSPETDEVFAHKRMDEAFQNIMKSADTKWGGFGKAPKFPQTFTIQFLLRYYYSSKNEEALQQALLSLDKMIEGGIYDQVGGGFSRYSTDNEWLAPHFEKMLYDNALVITILSEAYQLTKKERYKEVIEQTLDFLEREMLDGAGGFYAALDADSEGEEGKFYTWDYDEINKLLGSDAAMFCQYYNVSKEGNWEGKNILNVRVTEEEFAAKNSMTMPQLKLLLQKNAALLLVERNKRVRPGLDDKIILSWNALMNSACSKAFAATGMIRFKNRAEKNMQFLLDNLALIGDGSFHHTWKNGRAKHPAFLDDYACLINALIQLHEITANREWLQKARTVTEFVMFDFADVESGLFYFTPKDQTDIILRKKEVYDGATASGNSMMAYNLYRLGIFFDEKNWKAYAQNMLTTVGKVMVDYPSSFGMWTCFLLEAIYSTSEIVILGEDFEKQLWQVLSAYIPHKVVMASKESDFYYPLLTGKGLPGSTLIYLCRDFSCRQPVTDLQALLEQIGP